MSHNSGGGGSFKRIEQEWFARVREAQANYKQAVEQNQRMVDESDQALIESADGSFAVAKARRAMALALNEVVRCQQVLEKLVLCQEMPPPDDDERLLI
jgi:hypothetical protein